MKINVETKMVTLIGTPLKQSFAAQMQNAGYEASGINMVYFYTEADKEHLGDVVNGLRYMNFAGFAVTKPNKVRVLRYLDELDPLCRKMGASNTVVRTPEGKLIGYNTDGSGFYTSLTQEGPIKACSSASAAVERGAPCVPFWPITALGRFTLRMSLSPVPGLWSRTSTSTSRRWRNLFTMGISQSFPAATS